ncbi:MAG TPA: TIGR00730 family Rossman fold protein [Candidatus Binataceae bacterium]|nr:TIGR00730 family Rossman fold protein [Candidatus Binataceae bacterium]
MKRLCVFCGSSPGADPAYAHAARKLGSILAKARIGLVYGGASVGLMAEIADAAMEERGEVIGVIPRSMVDMEVAHSGLTDLRIVDSMHQRKALMGDLSDGFIAMPGGLGTLEEFFEVLTWAQLGMHAKPCGLLNVGGFYDQLLAFLDHATGQRFIKPAHRATVLVAESPEDLLAQFEKYRAPVSGKWIDRGQK